MPNAPWARLTEPFPVAALAWHAIDRDPEGTRLRLAQHLPADVVRARLDQVVGPDAWSLRLRPWGDAGLLAELTVLGAVRAGAVRVTNAPGDGGGAEAASAAALSAAADGFGMRTSLMVADDGWVDADPTSGEHLHLPDTVARCNVTGETGGGEPTGAAAGTEAAGGETRAAAPAPVPEPEAPEAGHETESTAEREPAPKPEAQRMIDRLMERLRAEGHGAEAAKLVMSYGGYGRDPQTSRELYARLRSLLIERSAST